MINNMFVWLWLVVNDYKFLVGIVFFSYTNQPAVLLHEPATIQTSQPNRLMSFFVCAKKTLIYVGMDMSGTYRV